MKTIPKHMVVDDAAIDAGDPFIVTEPISYIANIYGSETEYIESIKNLSPPQQYLWAFGFYVTEVNNGGHQQFYANSTGIVWPDALACARELGSPEIVDIFEQSIARLDGDPDPVRLIRALQLVLWQADFTDLDDRFYALQDSIDLDELMMNYIRNNRAAFYFDGYVEVPVFDE
jgi:hypothetical protein